MRLVAKTFPRGVTPLQKTTPSPCLSCIILQQCRFLSMMGENRDVDVDDFDDYRTKNDDQGCSPQVTVTRIQEQVAAQKLAGMTQLVRKLTQHPPSSTNNTINVSAQTLHESVLFWMSRPTRLVVQRQNGTGHDQMALQNALSIVFWAHEHHHQLLPQVADVATLSRLLRLWLSFSRNSSLEEQLEGLYQASCLYDLMFDHVFHGGRSSCSSSSEQDATNGLPALTMLLWNRRIQFLTRNNSNGCWSSDLRTTVALGGKTTALECLEEVQRIANQLDSGTADPSFYLTLLSSYAQLGAAQEAHTVLNQLEREQQSMKLTNNHYNAVLLAYSNRAAAAVDEDDGSNCRQQALHLWRNRMSQNPQLDRHHPVTMSILLTLLAKEPKQAQDLLESMPNPTPIHYNAVLTAWARSSKQHPQLASKRALHVLQLMQSRQVVPDHISYTAVMDALLQSNDRSALDQVDELLNQCYGHAHLGQASSSTDSSMTTMTRPDRGMYLVVLRGLLSYHRRHVESQVKEDICRRMEEILERMQDENHQDSTTTTTQIANVETYKLVLEAWSTSHSPLAASRAMQLLETMEQHQILPDVAALELILRCLSVKLKYPDWAVEQAKAVLDRLARYGLTETPELFQQYLRVLARSGNVQEAQELLAQRSINNNQAQSDEASYFSIVEGYARLPNRTVKADELLRQWTGPPSLRMMAVVMTSWAQHDHPHSIQRVEEIFQQAKQVSDNKLSGFFYGTYMKALGKRPNAPVLLEQLLTEMQRDYESGLSAAKPNASNFATVITAWAESRQEGAAERAEAILYRLEDLHQYDVELKPTVACYRGVIMAWASSNHPDCGHRAVAILDRLEQHPGLFPNRSCFNNTIKAIGRSYDLNKAENAFEMLLRMKQSYEDGNRHAEPSVTEYATTLRAIRSSKRSFEVRSEAYKVVERVLDMGKRSCTSLQDQEQLYLQYIWAAYRLLLADRNRDDVVKQALQNCSNELLLQPQIRKALQNVISRTTIQEMMSDKARRRKQPR